MLPKVKLNESTDSRPSPNCHVAKLIRCERSVHLSVVDSIIYPRAQLATSLHKAVHGRVFGTKWTADYVLAGTDDYIMICRHLGVASKACAGGRSLQRNAEVAVRV